MGLRRRRLTRWIGAGMGILTPYHQTLLNMFAGNIAAYWAAEELTGITALDISGNSRNGTWRNSSGVLNGVTLGQPGIVNGRYSVSLDGANGCADVFSNGVITNPANELCSNGGFSSGASWTAAGGWAISGGVATHTPGSAGDLSQSTLMLGTINYTLTYTISGCTAGTVTAKLGTTSLTARSANGTYTEAGNRATNGTLTFSASSDFDGSIDNVSLKATDGNGFNGNEGAVIAWVKMSGAGDWTDGADRRFFFFQADASNLTSIRKSSTNNTIASNYTAGGVSRSSNYAANSTDWIMVAVTWSLSANEVKHYYNCVQQGATATPGAWVGNPITMILGAANASASQPFKGWLDDIVLLTRCPTLAELVQLYQASGRAAPI